jgi:hypothetical protein
LSFQRPVDELLGMLIEQVNFQSDKEKDTLIVTNDMESATIPLVIAETVNSALSMVNSGN